MVFPEDYTIEIVHVNMKESRHEKCLLMFFFILDYPIKDI